MSESERDRTLEQLLPMIQGLMAALDALIERVVALEQKSG